MELVLDGVARSTPRGRLSIFLPTDEIAALTVADDDQHQLGTTAVLMRLIGVAVVLAVSLSLGHAPLSAEAQQSGKVYKLGWFAFSPPTKPVAARPPGVVCQ
jgi:hypothetical protein